MISPLCSRRKPWNLKQNAVVTHSDYKCRGEALGDLCCSSKRDAPMENLPLFFGECSLHKDHRVSSVKTLHGAIPDLLDA